jgi:hypothetical protein
LVLLVSAITCGLVAIVAMSMCNFCIQNLSDHHGLTRCATA